MIEPEILEVPTDHGPARVQLTRPAAEPVGLLLLGHGAGGGVGAPDLQVARETAVQAGLAVGLVEQPYRVAGRRAPAPPARVDAAWIAVTAHLAGADGYLTGADGAAGSAPAARGGAADAEFAGAPLITGGRSFGARVACRTADATGSVAVLCLAFPVHPPGRPEKSRQPELSGVTVPTLVVQGDRDPFGMPEGSDTRRVVVVAGDHSLRKGLAAVRTAVADWLPTVLTPGQ